MDETRRRKTTAVSGFYDGHDAATDPKHPDHDEIKSGSAATIPM